MIIDFGKKYERKQKYSIDFVLNNLTRKNKKEKHVVFINNEKKEIGTHIKVMDGDLVKMDSARYKVFKKSIVCAKCGLIGQYFWKERFVNSATDINSLGLYHFNLYGLLDGQEIQFTKDHIIPVSKGGKNTLSNFQTMCYICNQNKGNKIN